jgi:hypothetical protein
VSLWVKMFNGVDNLINHHNNNWNNLGNIEWGNNNSNGWETMNNNNGLGQ